MEYWRNGIMGDAITEVRDQNHRGRKNKKASRSKCEKVFKGQKLVRSR
jgi:hypothetical protein